MTPNCLLKSYWISSECVISGMWWCSFTESLRSIWKVAHFDFYPYLIIHIPKQWLTWANIYGLGCWCWGFEVMERKCFWWPNCCQSGCRRSRDGDLKIWWWLVGSRFSRARGSHWGNLCIISKMLSSQISKSMYDYLSLFKLSFEYDQWWLCIFNLWTGPWCFLEPSE